MSRITENPLIQKLLSLNLPSEDYAVFGSGPMFAHGIKDLSHDVDIIARGKAWEKALTLGQQQISKIDSILFVDFFGGEVSAFNSWAPGVWSIDDLINSADIIDGIRFVTLENVYKWKKLRNSEKDKEHLELLEDYFRQRPT